MDSGFVLEHGSLITTECKACGAFEKRSENIIPTKDVSVDKKNDANAIPFYFELIGSKDFETYYRAKVFGGWLVQTNYVSGVAFKQTLTFVADPNHQWEVSNSV
jgi:hypothetical protein